MGEKLPQQAADEGRACRKSPFTGRPAAQPPLIRHRFAQPPAPLLALCATSPVPGESVPQGKTFEESLMSNYNPYTKRQTMIAPDYEVYRYRSTYMNEVELHHHDFYEV